MKEYTLTADFSLLNSLQAGQWMDMADKVFKKSYEHSRLLGNLLIMARYINTLCQGLAVKGKKISLGLECAQNLLWDYLEGRVIPAELQDFANDYYDCLLAYNIGNVKTDAPEEFYNKYFADENLNAYELLAIEWSSGLLLQIVSIAGGRIDFDDFEECERIDFYGIDIMIDTLKHACMELAGISNSSNMAQDLEIVSEHVCRTALFQSIIKNVRDDLQIALETPPSRFASLRNEYRKYTIIPTEYAEKLLE